VRPFEINLLADVKRVRMSAGQVRKAIREQQNSGGEARTCCAHLLDVELQQPHTLVYNVQLFTGAHRSMQRFVKGELD
jgi:hypothetical protein